MTVAIDAGGCGGGSPSSNLSRIGTHISNINNFKAELDSTELNDSNYTIQKVKDKATEAANVLTEAKAQIEALVNDLC